MKEKEKSDFCFIFNYQKDKGDKKYDKDNEESNHNGNQIKIGRNNYQSQRSMKKSQSCNSYDRYSADE